LYRIIDGQPVSARLDQANEIDLENWGTVAPHLPSSTLGHSHSSVYRGISNLMIDLLAGAQKMDIFFTFLKQEAQQLTSHNVICTAYAVSCKVVIHQMNI